MMELKQQGLTVIRAVHLMGRDGGDELFDFDMVNNGCKKLKIKKSDGGGVRKNNPGLYQFIEWKIIERSVWI